MPRRKDLITTSGRWYVVSCLSALSHLNCRCREAAGKSERKWFLGGKKVNCAYGSIWLFLFGWGSAVIYFFFFFSLAIPVISISLLNSLFHQWIMAVRVTPVSNLLLAFLGFYLKSDMRLIGHVYGTLHIIIKAWKIWAAEKINGWLTCKWVERLCLCGSGWDKIISKASNIVASSCNFFFICCHQISTFMMKYSILFLCICLYYMSLLF